MYIPIVRVAPVYGNSRHGTMRMDEKQHMVLEYGDQRIFYNPRSYFGPEVLEAFSDRVEAELHQELADGRDISVIALGGARTGKTYSMFGESDGNSGLVHSLLGRALAREDGKQAYAEVQILEANEDLRDLLNNGNVVKVKQDGAGVEVIDSCVSQARTVAEVDGLISEARRRASKETHFVVLATVYVGAPQLRKLKFSARKAKRGQSFVFIDAASEKSVNFQYTNLQSSMRLLSAKTTKAENANQSLFKLRVALLDMCLGRKPQFRIAQLTRLLKNTAAGNGCIVPILHVNPENFAQTKQTLHLCKLAQIEQSGIGDIAQVRSLVRSRTFGNASAGLKIEAILRRVFVLGESVAEQTQERPEQQHDVFVDVDQDLLIDVQQKKTLQDAVSYIVSKILPKARTQAHDAPQRESQRACDSTLQLSSKNIPSPEIHPGHAPSSPLVVSDLCDSSALRVFVAEKLSKIDQIIADIQNLNTTV